MPLSRRKRKYARTRYWLGSSLHQRTKGKKRTQAKETQILSSLRASALLCLLELGRNAVIYAVSM